MKQIITKQKQTTAIKPVCVVYLYTDEETRGLDTAPKKVTEEIKERVKGAIGVYVEKRFGIK